MNDLRLADLLDLAILQKMANAHYRAAGMPTGIIDAIDGSILVGAGWQDICLRFHRANPLTLQRCQESDDFIKALLVEGEACHYKCKNGLWDIGIPIVVSGRHLATMFLGQFFYEGEVPDRAFFVQLAGEFDFAVEEYLGALDRVPVFSREKVDYILEYDKALVSFIADLAEHSIMRLRSEAAVKQQAEFLQVLIDAMPCPVFYKDRDGLYLGCNRAFERILGVSREEIIGKTAFEIASKELAEVCDKADADVLAHAGTQTYETSIQSIDGFGHDLLLQHATFAEPDGEIGGVVGALIDITDRKRAEREKARLQEQLAQARKLESVGRLAGGVAHDFNNMLGVILGNAELALADLDPAHPVFRNLEGIRQAAHHSADLTRQLLAFARKQTVAPRKLDLNDTIGHMLPMLQRLIGENIDLGWKPGPSLWQVKIDPG